jgi:hypothetical protein
MASTTTHSPIDSHPVTAPATATLPPVPPRPSRRTAAWILAGTVTLAVVSVTAGLGYRAYESSRDSAAAVGSASPTRSDAAEWAHGSGLAAVTGNGHPLHSAGVESAPVVPSSDSSLLAHGTRGTLADASGRPLDAPR